MKDKISLVLSRFHLHKSNPAFAAALVLKLVCSKEEEIVLDKEQKLMKSFGLDKVESTTVNNMNTYAHMQPNFLGNPFVHNHPYVMPPRFPFPPRRPRPRMPHAQSSGPLCFRCQKPGHLMRDCPAVVNNSG